MMRRPTSLAEWSPTDLDDVLDRYATARLAPRSDQLDRGRTAVLHAFAQRRVAGDAHGLRGWPLAAAFGLILVMAGTVVAAESGPGQPFYGLRLAIGSITLASEEPAHGLGLAHQLDDRLAEAGVAARKGDGRGAEAALSEYLHTLSELAQNGITDPDILNLLQRHQDTLQELLSVAPAEATGGVQQALSAAGQASEPTASDAGAVPHPTPQENPAVSPPATGRP
jgi:hypothetical protein